MADISAQEMTASVRRAAGLRGDVTPGLGLPLGEQRAVINAATEQVRLAKGQAALEAFASAPGFTSGGWEAVLEAKIYTDFHPDGTRRARPGTNEAARFNEVRNTMRAYEDYMTHGFDRLTGTAAEIANKRAILRTHMHDFLVSNPSFRMALAPAWAPNTIPQAVVDENLRDDALGLKLAEVLKDKLKPEEIAENEDAYFDKRKDVETERQNRAEFVRQRDAANNRHTDATNERNNFNTSATYTVASIAGRPPETEASAVAFLQGQIAASADANVQQFKNNLDQAYTLNQQINQATPPPNLAALQASLTAVDALLVAARGNAADGAKCGEFESLYTQRRSIEDRRDAASHDVTRLNGEIATKDIDIAKKNAALGLAAGKKRSGSGDFALTIEQAFHEAAKKHLATKAKYFIDNYRDERTSATKDAVGEQERVMDRYMESRWVTFRPQSFWHQWRRPSRIDVRRAQARADFTTIMGAGVDNVIRDILHRSGVPQGQAALMMQDDKDETSFMHRKRTEVIGKVLAAYVVSGGKLRQHQLNAIAMSPYGKDAVDKMQTESTAAGQRRDTAISAGFTKDVPKDLRERMIEGTPPWPATQTTMKILLSPMRLLRPGAIQMGKLAGTIDVS